MGPGPSGPDARGEAPLRVARRSSAHRQELIALLEKAADKFGRVDVFVANAGTGHGILLVGSPLSEMEHLLESNITTNLIGTLRGITMAARKMAADGLGGRVAIVSSANGLISFPGYALYSATKFGHRGFGAGASHE